MKKWLTLFIVAMFAVVLVACGNDEDSEDEKKANDEANKDSTDSGTNEKSEDKEDKDKKKDTDKNKDEETKVTDNDDMLKKMNELNYTDFELEVSYADDQEYEAEIGQESGKIKADLEDEIKNIDVKGKDAFNKIYPNLKKLDVTKDTKKKDVIKQVLSAFDLEDDYEELEVEFRFKDDTKTSFEDRK